MCIRIMRRFIFHVVFIALIMPLIIGCEKRSDINKGWTKF